MAVSVAFFAVAPGFVGAQERPGEPIVLFVHGRGQSDTATADAQTRTWQAALLTGIHRAGLKLGEIGTDFRVVWYADVLRSGYKPSERCASTRGASDQLLSLSERARLFLAKTIETMPGAERAILGRLASDTYTYLTDTQLQCEVDGRLQDSISAIRADHRPIIVIAHSMGSLIAYKFLLAQQRDTSLHVADFVTVGSQIGVPEVQHALRGQLVSGFAYPRDASKWVNFIADRDLLGFHVGPSATGDPTRTVVNVKVRSSDPNNPHDAASYLATPAVAREIVVAWCSAFAPPSRRPSSCPSADRSDAVHSKK